MNAAKLLIFEFRTAFALPVGEMLIALFPFLALSGGLSEVGVVSLELLIGDNDGMWFCVGNGNPKLGGGEGVTDLDSNSLVYLSLEIDEGVPFETLRLIVFSLDLLVTLVDAMELLPSCCASITPLAFIRSLCGFDPTTTVLQIAITKRKSCNLCALGEKYCVVISVLMSSRNLVLGRTGGGGEPGLEYAFSISFAG